MRAADFCAVFVAATMRAAPVSSCQMRVTRPTMRVESSPAPWWVRIVIGDSPPPMRELARSTSRAMFSRVYRRALRDTPGRIATPEMRASGLATPTSL